jgi:chromosome segregation ATPase
MKTILQAIRDVLVVAVLALLAVVCLDVHRSLTNTAGQARYTLDNANRLIRELAQTSANVRHATAEWEAASKQQSAEITTAAQTTTADLQQFGVVLQQAQGAIGDARVTIANVDRDLDAQNAAALAVELQAQKTLAALEHQTDELAPILANLDKLTADPSLPDTLHQLDATMADAQKAMVSLDSIAASGDRDALMLEDKLREALKPATLTKTIFMRALGLAAPMAQIATAVK